MSCRTQDDVQRGHELRDVVSQDGTQKGPAEGGAMHGRRWRHRVALTCCQPVYTRETPKTPNLQASGAAARCSRRSGQPIRWSAEEIGQRSRRSDHQSDIGRMPSEGQDPQEPPSQSDLATLSSNPPDTHPPLNLTLSSLAPLEFLASSQAMVYIRYRLDLPATGAPTRAPMCCFSDLEQARARLARAGR